MRPELAALADREYVLLTTYRRTGVAVDTPVWIARDGDRLLVTTGARSGKVKRLRHTPRVTLRACDVRGRVTTGADPVDAYARVDASPETRARLDAAFEQKYRMKYRVLRKMRRRDDGSVTLVVTDPDA